MESSDDWGSCLDSVAVAEGFVYGTCPHGHPDTTDFSVTVTVMDSAGVPMPKVPPDSIYVTLSGDCVSPPDSLICNELGYIDCDSVDTPYVFWCGVADELFATDSTDAKGQTVIIHSPVSGRARLRVTPHAWPLATGETASVWISGCDHTPDAGEVAPNGRVDGSDFANFGTAYSDWTFHDIENWTWDLVHPAGDACMIGSEERPIFKVGPSDFASFGCHYGHECPDTCECHQ
jgi:hypothetical protein